jgi:CRISPR/Cas system-associated endonuclease Cas1
LTRDRIDRKLAGQEQNAHHVLRDEAAATAIALTRERLPLALTITDMRVLESQAALAYWRAWRALPVMFPRADLPRIPKHCDANGFLSSAMGIAG